MVQNLPICVGKVDIEGLARGGVGLDRAGNGEHDEYTGGGIIRQTLKIYGNNIITTN
jgi:hypothetical protein